MRKLRYNRKDRIPTSANNRNVFQAWPTGPSKTPGKRLRSLPTIKYGKRRYCPAMIRNNDSLPNHNRSLNTPSDNEASKVSVKSTPVPTVDKNLSQTIDLTMDESIQDPSANQTMNDSLQNSITELPSQTSFSKILEDRPSTSKSISY